MSEVCLDRLYLTSVCVLTHDKPCPTSFLELAQQGVCGGGTVFANRFPLKYLFK